MTMPTLAELEKLGQMTDAESEEILTFAMIAAEREEAIELLTQRMADVKRKWSAFSRKLRFNANKLAMTQRGHKGANGSRSCLSSTLLRAPSPHRESRCPASL